VSCTNLSSTASGGIEVRGGPVDPIFVPSPAARDGSTLLPSSAPVNRDPKTVGTGLRRISPNPAEIPLRAAGPDRPFTARGQPAARIVQ
jgi:hypothetical protein